MFVVFRFAKPIGLKKQKYGSSINSSGRYDFPFFAYFRGDLVKTQHKY